MPSTRNAGPADFAGFSTAALRRETRRRRLLAAGRDVRSSPRSATGRRKENPEYIAMLAALLDAAVPRVGEEADIANLPALAALPQKAEAVLGRAVWALHDRGFSWTDIGNALGVANSSPFRRFARYRPQEKEQT